MSMIYEEHPPLCWYYYSARWFTGVQLINAVGLGNDAGVNYRQVLAYIYKLG